MEGDIRSGFVAIVGRPNVGKSTLMNHMIGQKISITSRKPQTTRHQILGVRTKESSQIVFVDTPGLHTAKNKTLGRYMNRVARGSLADVDCVLLVISANEAWSKQEENILALIKKEEKPVILVLNKIDKLDNQEKLFPLVDDLRTKHEFQEIVPVSALRGTQLDQLVQVILERLPVQDKLYPDEQLTDKSERFMVSEILREQIFRQVGQEVPYSVAVDIEEYKESKNRVEIRAIIYVEKSGQKAILIGKNGARIKSIGTAAREAAEKFLNKKVHIETWIKVKEKWSDDARALRSFGYGDGSK